MLRERDFKDVLLIIRKALASTAIEELQQEVLNRMAKVFGCDQSHFFLPRKCLREFDFEHALYKGVDEKYKARYVNYYHSLDPFMQRYSTLPPVTTNDDFISYKDLLNSEYYNNFLRPQSIRHQMVLTLRSGEWLLGGVSFCRPKSANRFSSRDKGKAKFIVPYLVEIMKKQVRIEEITQGIMTFESLTDIPPNEGMILLNEYLKPIYMDKKAYTVLYPSQKEETSCERWGLQLPKSLLQECENFKASAVRGRSSDLVHCEATMFVEQVGQDVPVALRLIERLGKRAFLICFKPEDPALLLDQRLAKMGLSKREREVTYLICKGLRNKQISDLLCISWHTVGNHLKSIYDKCGINNRTSLTNMVIHLKQKHSFN